MAPCATELRLNIYVDIAWVVRYATFAWILIAEDAPWSAETDILELVVLRCIPMTYGKACGLAMRRRERIGID